MSEVTISSVDYLKSCLAKAGKSEALDLVWGMLKDCCEIEELIESGQFSPSACDDLKKTWNLLQEENKRAWALQERIDEEKCRAYADKTWCASDFDEIASEAVAYAIVYKNEILVTADGTGMGQKIPSKNRKYVGGKGDMRWAYPVSELPAILSCRAISFVLNEDGSKVEA